jgi:hypothetical protein
MYVGQPKQHKQNREISICCLRACTKYKQLYMKTIKEKTT